MNIDAILQGMIGNTGQRIGQIQSQVGDMQADTAAMRGLMTQNLAEGQQLAQQVGQIAAQEAEVNYKMQKAQERAAATVGLDEDDLNNQLVQSMAEYNSAQEAKKQQLQRYQEIQSRGLLDNPLGYILGQLELPQVVNTHNALNAKAAAAADNISTRQQLLQQHKSAMVVNTAEAVKDINLQKAEAGVAQAQLALREAEINNISKISGRKLQEFQHANSIFAIQDAAFAKQLQVAQFKMNLEDRQAAREERRALAEAKLKEKEAQDAAIAEFDTQSQRISQFLGLQVPINYAMWQKMANPKQKQAWFEAVTTGEMGSNLLQSLQFVNSQGNSAALRQNNPGVAAATQGFMTAIDSVAGPLARRPENLKKKPDELAAEATNIYTNTVVGAASRADSGNSLFSAQWDTLFNPYKAEYRVLLDEATAGKIPALQNNIVVKTLSNLAPALDPAASNLSADSQNKLMLTIAEQVRRREIGLDEAAQQVSQFYTIAALKNKDLYQYDLLGLPPQTRYMATFGTTGMFGSTVTADLMNTMSAKKALATLAAGAEKKVSSGAGVLGVPVGSSVQQILQGQQPQ